MTAPLAVFGMWLSCLLQLLLAVRIPTSLAFLVPHGRCRRLRPPTHPGFAPARLVEPPSASTGGSSARRRRRRVPTGAEPSGASGPAAAASQGDAAAAPEGRDPPLVRPRDAPVELTVQNVRRAVAGSAADTAEDVVAPSPATKTPMSSFTAPAARSAPATKQGGSADDALQQLLIDAQEMRSVQEQTDAESFTSPTQTIRNVLSTVVTVDFFVVCGFLLWFLAGIFCSTVLRDDTVQIAFNSNFQAFVQPALGVLMIASIASAVVGGDDDSTDKQ